MNLEIGKSYILKERLYVYVSKEPKRLGNVRLESNCIILVLNKTEYIDLAMYEYKILVNNEIFYVLLNINPYYNSSSILELIV